MADTDAERIDLIAEAISKAFARLYGPRHCEHCGGVQSVIVHKVIGSETLEIKGMKATIGFTGAVSCGRCFRPVQVAEESISG